MTSNQQQRREAALQGPCPYCGVLRGEHDMATMMPHTMLAFGVTEDEANQVWGRVLDRISPPVKGRG